MSVTTMGQRIALVVAFVAMAAPASAKPRPYLSREPTIALWLPTQPVPGDITDMADMAVYFESRPLAESGTPSLATAQADDVLSARDLGLRFSEAAGGLIDDRHAEKLLALMDRVLLDDTKMLGLLKRDVRQGGRVRPYVRFPAQPVCKHDVDDSTWHLNDTGSYPSGHATYGWMWGLILSSILPERADAVMEKAYGFGQSRLICGFHYQSDLLAGGLAASVLFARISADVAFQADLDSARIELRMARGLPTTRIASKTIPAHKGRVGSERSKTFAHTAH